MKLIITTQVYENYGAHAWDGTGECPQYWKAKGGDEYVFPLGSSLTSSELTAFVESATPHCTREDAYFREYVIDWSVVDDDALTQWEQDQLQYEGAITSPSPVLSL